ncbi:hypothetical protein H6F93_00495 [Leptolyngbya sp. FACHB-671]|uniref:hypothetical protein n=1 Tax=Leptolyngbya sp. FACHB-671 TaxID=2692812 RepID=UPI0016864E62|nr:hypothetical protein [Leptolyngbya sp. FACHB-671]MBD2066029.1 hypothetical protein [Leptolyngbya sp. FACHB-671]
MATENKRIVGYLPKDYYTQLREYMEREHISESAALVRMVKQFFDTPNAHPDVEAEVAALKTQMQQVLSRIGVLEQLAQTRPAQRKGSASQPHPMLQSLSREELARRMGVSSELLLDVASKGETEFQQWCRHRDPGKRLWRREGEMFHPVEE